MDLLAKVEEPIQIKIFEATKKRVPEEKIELLFFDVTTLYFESHSSDELRATGYSKDHKIGETQVVLALATTFEGHPIGYGLFPGNTAEVKTLLNCLREWRKKIPIDNVVVIGDRAMMSEANLLELENAQIKYVIAAKLKSLPNDLKTMILHRQNEKTETLLAENVHIQEQTYNGRRLVISFSQSRADKDRSDRERLILKLKSKLNVDGTIDPKRLISNRGYLKYTKENKKGQIAFKDLQIEAEAKWDGLHGVITNDNETKGIELLARYRGLWIIEESFRINKHTLEMRPIYHYKPQRIRAHILLCYIAFALSRYVQKQVSIMDNRMSIEHIREALAGVEASILEDVETKQTYKISSKISREAGVIYRAMGVNRKL
jgi:transposase